MNSNEVLKGQRALVTGGSSGIGRAIAEALIAQGASVMVTSRNERRLTTAAEDLGCEYVAGDVGAPEDAERIVETTAEKLGGLDILINNAGFGTFAPLLATELEDFEAVLQTNVIGAFLMGKVCAGRFVDQGSGAIVNIASTAATKGFQGGTAYAASKFALRGMTECWREELRRYDVRVHLINPSEVITDFAQVAGYDQEVNDKKLRPEDIAHAVVAVLSMNPRGFIPELGVFATNPF
nr:uncharacterized oxidoreductase YoxD-like [Nerophis lumbriciformis]